MQAIEYFTKGARSDYIDPLTFLNFLWKQYLFVKENGAKSPEATIGTLKSLPLNHDELRHILYFFIIEWVEFIELDTKLESIYQLLDNELFTYEVNTPEKLERTQKKMEQLKTNATEVQARFKLSDKLGVKINLIRILHALYGLNIIEKSNGQPPTKKEFMEAFGKFIGTDLSKYSVSLSQAFNEQPMEVNLKIFHDMIKITQDRHYMDNPGN